MVYTKILKYNDNMHQNDKIHVFNGKTNQIFAGMNACYHNTLAVANQEGGISMIVVVVKHQDS